MQFEDLGAKSLPGNQRKLRAHVILWGMNPATVLFGQISRRTGPGSGK